MIATSEIRITCVVAEADGDQALKAVHQAFELDVENQHKLEGAK